MIKIDELNESPRVGKFYLVKCIKLNQNGIECFGKEWVPIIGPKHDDEGPVNFPYNHYHIDWRFIYGLADYKRDIRGDSITGYEFARVICLPGNGISEYSIHASGLEIEYKTRKCARVYGGDYNFPVSTANGEVRFLKTLEKEFKGCKLKAGHICPHKGINLSSIAPDENGLIVCPGHGLAFNSKTLTQTKRPRK